MTKAKSPPARRTVTKWLEVAGQNVIARRMAAAKFKLADLGQRGGVGLRAVYISGPPGVGKTHSIVEQEKVWRSSGLEPLRFRPQNVRDLIDYFAAAQGRRPLIMEEADIIFRSKPMFEILKQATDPLTPDTFHRIEKIEGEKVEVAINLNVPIVVSTNMDLTNDAGWDKDLLADRDALFNRSRPVIVPDDTIALTSRGFDVAAFQKVAELINRILDAASAGDVPDALIDQTRDEVVALCARYPIYATARG